MGHREVAIGELAVLVGQERVAGELAGLCNRSRVPRPVLLRDAADGDAAVLAVEGTVEIEVALDPSEVGQHVLPAPAGGTPGLPFVVVARRAAVGQLAVDRGPATQHARLLVFAQGRAFLIGVVVADDLGRHPELGPVEARIEIGQARIAVANLRRFVAGRRVLARFAKKDLVSTSGGEPLGHDRPGRAAAHDDGVVHVLRSLCGFRRLAHEGPSVTPPP
jgi:hypothetical protein